jgi:hypothetical protein
MVADDVGTMRANLALSHLYFCLFAQTKEDGEAPMTWPRSAVMDVGGSICSP